jgi:hypothetical protein
LIANPPLPEGRPPCLARARARGACKDGERVKLYSRPGNDLTYRFPLIVEGLAVCTRCGTIGADVRPDWGPHVNKRRV